MKFLIVVIFLTVYITFVAAESTYAEAVVRTWGDVNGIEIKRSTIRKIYPKQTMLESFFEKRQVTNVLTFPQVNMSCASFYSEIEAFLRKKEKMKISENEKKIVDHFKRIKKSK